jgi:hypothetical protein
MSAPYPTSGRAGRHDFDVAGPPRGVQGTRLAFEPLSRPRQSLLLHPEGGEAVDKEQLTQVGRALGHLGIEHIPAYSAQARGRSERMFGTLQGRLPQELRLAGIDDIEEANRYIREIYLPLHNAQFVKPPQIAEESAFVAVSDPASLTDILCIQQERIVANDNTVAYEGRTLQLPQSPVRAHYVKARIKVHQYSDGTLAVFHGPRRLARFSPQGEEIAAVPTASSGTPCSPPPRMAAGRVGTKKPPPGRTKKLTQKKDADVVPISL